MDRLVGPWLCRRLRPGAGELANTTPMAPVEIRPESIRRILVVRPGGLGDAALTWPMLSALRSGFPAADIDILAENRNAGIYRIGELVSDIYLYDRKPLSTLRRLRRLRYDLIIDTEQYHHLSVVIANALRPRFLAGFDTLGRRRLHTHSVRHHEDTYEACSFLELAEALLNKSIEFDCDRAFIQVHAPTREWAAQEIAVHGMQKFIAVTPCAGGPYRLWPPERYAEVVGWLIRRGYPVVLLGGADGVDAAQKIVSLNPGTAILDLTGQTSLVQSAALLERAALSVSGDTGILHLAYGVGTPTVALFGSGLHRKWAPPGKRHRIVRKGLECSPCTRDGRVPPCPHAIACMQTISVAEVTEAIDELLEG
jgi:lipopolysaccharide heptosyltransferase II